MKSIGSIIRSILRKAAQLAVIPFEVVINGVRMLLYRTPPLVDQAADAIDEDVPETSSETRAARALTESRDAVRVQNAAKEMLKDLAVSRRHLDPQFAGDARKLAWLQSLTRTQLAIVGMADIRKLDQHLNGTRALPMSLVTDFDDVVEEKKEVARVQANANANDRNVAVLQQLRKQAAARSGR